MSADGQQGDAAGLSRGLAQRGDAGGRPRGPALARLAVFRALAGNAALARVVTGYALFVLTEYSVWIAMLVYAYSHGGATVAGLVALAQLVPAALFAPVAAAIADRRSPVVLLAGGYVAQAAGMGATAAAVLSGAPLAAYAAAAVASTAVTTTRPAQSTLIPSLCASPDQLTAANVIVGWVEATAITVAGLLTGLLITAGSSATVFATCAGLALIACALVARLRAGALVPPEQPATILADLGDALRIAARWPRLRLMLALLTAEAAVVGGLDLLFVILAVSVLGRSQAWAGYLNSAYGAGAVLAATVSAALVGRRLGLPVLAAALVLSGALAALAFGVGLAGTVALLTLVGASRALLDVASRSLLQRSVPVQLIGRVFGVLEGLTMAGLAAGALLVPALTNLGGSRLALIGVAAVLPLAALAGARHLFDLDAGARVRVVEIALLRSLPLFAELPAPAIEGLAAALVSRDVPAWTELIRQGEPGDAYYAIAAGDFEVRQDGLVIRRRSRGDGVGEIALLRAIPRTATVTALSDGTVYELGREPFLAAVLGHAATERHASRAADNLLAGDASAARSAGNAPCAGAVERACDAECGGFPTVDGEDGLTSI
jgi:MFS family permease